VSGIASASGHDAAGSHAGPVARPDWRFQLPVFAGDTLNAGTRVVEKDRPRPRKPAKSSGTAPFQPNRQNPQDPITLQLSRSKTRAKAAGAVPSEKEMGETGKAHALPGGAA